MRGYYLCESDWKSRFNNTYKMSDTVWHFIFIEHHYIGCIYRDTCTTLRYIRAKIFCRIEDYALSLPLKKKVNSQWGAMTAHELFLATDDIFH